MSYLYNVYDDSGNRIIERKPSREVADALKIDILRVSRCAEHGTKVYGIYTLEKIEEKAKSQDCAIPNWLQLEWDEVTQLFKHVKWVKEKKRGVRKLHGRKKN